MPVAVLDGYLTSDRNGYRATEKGRETNLKGMQGFTDVLAPLQPMPPAELKRLADYLIRLSEATSAAPEPPSHFCHSAYKNYKRTFPSDAPLPRLFVHYIKELDFDYLKLDGSFIVKLTKNTHDQVFVRAMVEISKVFGLSVIAEWVEDEETVTMLRDLGVTMGQGYHFGKPAMLNTVIKKTLH